MVDLDFFSYSDVHRTVIDTIPAIRELPIAAVSYVPRGGSLIASIVAQILDLPLLDPTELARSDPERCLLVDDMIVTGKSLSAFRRRFLPAGRASPTYVFASVPQERPADTAVDIVSITVDPERYFLLPWEISDIFRPTFPFPILVDLDGVIRAPSSQPILSTPHPIAHLLSFGRDPARDRHWLASHGYRYHQLSSLPDAADLAALARLIREQQIRLYLSADRQRAAAIKPHCPSCHVIAFSEMIEL